MWKWWIILFSLFLSTTLWAESDNPQIQRWKFEGWNKTNFEKRQVPLDEILSGGPPRDGIPPIYNPTFESIAEASKWLPDSEPVLVFQEDKVAKAYPYRVLIWHEIVNDEYQGKSFIVTFCPLCNSAIIFNTHFDGKNHAFGVSGKLRNSDMVMWDHTTESWWQQLTGTAIIGDATGTQLEMLPSPAVSYGTFKETFPQGQVLSQNTEHSRPYGDNPYAGYEHSSRPFLMQGAIDERLPALSRVIGIEWEGDFYTLPLSAMTDKKWAALPVKNGKTLLLFNLSPANAALSGRSIAASALIDHVTLWEPPNGEEIPEFTWNDGVLQDKAQKLSWNAFGQGKNGDKVVTQLKPVNFGVHFSFAWLAFHPDSTFLKL